MKKTLCVARWAHPLTHSDRPDPNETNRIDLNIKMNQPVEDALNQLR
jgi:hypothetical protein